MRYALLVSVMFLLACGDKGGTSPTAVTTSAPPVDRALAAGTILTLVSAETDEPVDSATVVVAGTSYTSDTSGRIVLASRVPLGGLIDVSASRFLDRQTLVRSNEETHFPLFPKTSPTGLDEAFTKEILYTSGRTGEALPMIRLRPGTTEAWVVPSPQIRADLSGMRFVEGAVQMITDATRGQVVFRLTESPPPGALYFDLVVDPEGVRREGDFAAIADWNVSSWAVTGGTVRYLSMDYVRSSTTVHELGHMFGMEHSSGSHDVMNTNRDRGRADHFSLRERLIMNLMLKRRPGNAHPDDDRRAPTQWQLRGPEGRFTSTVRCVS